MVIEKSVTNANRRLAVTHGIPGEGNPRGYVIEITGISLGHIEGFLCRSIESRRRLELRRQLEVIAHAIVQSESWIDLPAILDKESHERVVEQSVGIPDALDECRRQAQSVGLHAGETWDGHAIECRGQRQVRRGKPAEVHHAAEIQFKDLRFLGTQLDVIDVRAHLKSMMSLDP